MTSEKIRSVLKESGYSVEQIDNIKGKPALLAEYGKMTKKNLSSSQNLNFQTIFEGLELPPVILNKENSALSDKEPELGSPEWNDYDLSLMRPTEMFNGSPTCAGLRRISQLLLGDILSSKPVFTNVIYTEQGLCSTVGFEITFLWKRPICIESDLSNPLPYTTRIYGDVSDCGIFNTPEPYSLHPSATASSRSEARCLRKALQLNILSAEELSNSTKKDTDMLGTFDNDRISDTQKVFIEFKCRQLEIDMNKFISTNTDKPLNQICRTDAVELIKKLNSYQFDTNNSESKEIPDNIKI